MKKILLIGLTTLICFAGFISCDDWTETEAKVFETGDGKSDEYYANLRQWKAETQHDMAFGWYGFWSGSGVNLKNTMKGLPDSLHMVSVWGPWLPSTLTDAKKADLKYVQEVKGTKVLACSFAAYVGNGITSNTPENLAAWGWTWEHTGATGDNTSCTHCVATDPAERELQLESIRKYARAMADSTIAGGYDGLDIDFEPSWSKGAISNHFINMEEFIKELGKYLGPKSANPHLILAIDGECEYLTRETGPYVDYFIKQNYWGNEGANETQLNSRLKSVIDALVSSELSAKDIAKKYLTTVNFESYAANGGFNSTTSFTKPDGSKTNQLQGHAEWQPVYDGVTLQKGGYGSFHIEAEYTVSGMSGFYPWTRAAMKAVHPPHQ
ncbi:hypothetical protein GGR21_003823 [Dysgonomonas hofstadii]|uniref:Endoglycosidase n=1 Tax=Dysgonomonas hofstadii TaxID=637886 RepID=A0A840CT83_9BACT|nr:glycoside hydrolase family 18 [Dysgonomonas hofstadii]MBB4037899.1 hypothetical protein [Dysgonomonas hofstadii]